MVLGVTGCHGLAAVPAVALESSPGKDSAAIRHQLMEEKLALELPRKFRIA